MSGSNIAFFFFPRDLASSVETEAPKRFPEQAEYAYNQLLMMEPFLQKKETEMKRNRMPEFRV